MSKTAVNKPANPPARPVYKLGLQRRLCRMAGVAILCACLALRISPSAAHPHIFVNAKLVVAVDNHNRVQKLTQTWYFDRLFSASVVLDFDKTGKRFLDAQDLKALASTVKQSLAEFNYFQSVNADGKTLALAPPDEIIADMADGQLMLSFATTPKEPLVIQPGGHYRFSLYDPSFYVSVSFKKDIDIRVEGLPSFCRTRFERPDYNKILSTSRAHLTEEFFANPDTAFDLAQQLAPRLDVTCQK